MSKYKWDFKQIRNIRDALLLMYNETEEENKDCVLPLIDMYSSMLALAKRKKDEFDVFDDRFQGLDTMELISEVSNSYITKNFEILDVLLKGYTTVNENFIEDDGIDPMMICDNDYLISITKDYFKKMTPTYIYNDFLNVIDNNKSFLNISYSKENGDYGGVTIFDSIFNKKYVSVSRTNNLFDLVILPHEMFHYLFNDTAIDAFGNYNTYYLTEVEGSFSNILFGEYFKENSTEYNLFFTKRYINNFQAQMDEIAIRNQLLDSIKNNKTVRLNKLNKFYRTSLC